MFLGVFVFFGCFVEFWSFGYLFSGFGGGGFWFCDFYVCYSYISEGACIRVFVNFVFVCVFEIVCAVCFDGRVRVLCLYLCVVFT